METKEFINIENAELRKTIEKQQNEIDDLKHQMQLIGNDLNKEYEKRRLFEDVLRDEFNLIIEAVKINENHGLIENCNIATTYKIPEMKFTSGSDEPKRLYNKIKLVLSE